MTEPPFQPSTDELVVANAEYARTFVGDATQAAPARRLAVVVCMDTRIDDLAIFGLGTGEAHIIRNAGGVVTDDVIRSLCLSQRALGTREIVLVHHTDCGLQGLDAEAFVAELETETGERPSWTVESFDDPYDDVRESIRRLVRSPFVPHTEHLRGFVFDVATGRLDEVTG